MAPPRLPRAKARAKGSDSKNPARFEGRNEPIVFQPIGEPFAWMKPNAKLAWADMVAEIPWLNGSHRGILQIAATIRGRMMGDSAEEVGVQAMNLYRQCLGQMGATPADASKAGAMPGGEEKRDPSEQYF